MEKSVTDVYCMKLKLLVTGAQGQLGSTLLETLHNGGNALGEIPAPFHEAEVRGVGRAECDLAQREPVLRLVERERPDVLFHCAAFTQVDACEADPEAAFLGNALAARNVAMAAEHIGAKLVHVSTDYVFDGTATAPAPEWTLPNPQSVYGHSKLLGEQYVRAFCSRSFILRTAWLYGETGGNFVKTILRLAREKEEIAVVDDQLGNPTYAGDLAWHMLQIAGTEEYGLYHVTGNGVCSWHAFAAEIVRLSGLPCRVTPCTTAEYPRPAKRPAYSALAHYMLRHTVGDHMRPWQEALAEYMRHQD